MKNVIGFRDSEALSVPQRPENPPAQAPAEPVKSVVFVRFDGIKKEYQYYNDRFDLAPGDRVFVSGKLFGRPGVVTHVNTRFRIHLSDYEIVLAKPDMRMTGTFSPVRDKMVSLDTDLSPERFAAMVTPPADPDEEPDEIVCGAGWETMLSDFENDEISDPEIGKEGLHLCLDGAVVYFSRRQEACTAILREEDVWHRVDFLYHDGTGRVTNLFCDCVYPPPYLCRHACAALLTLKMLLNQEMTQDCASFTAVDRAAFWRMAAGSEAPVTLES